MNKSQIVVIGAGYAGMMTALRLAGRDHQRLTEVTLVNASDRFVERIRLHQFAANQTLAQRSIRKLLGKRPVNFVQGWVSAIDPDTRIVHVETDSEARRIPYDALVYALGSVAAKSSIPGVAEHTYSIASKAEAAALRDRLAQAEAGSRVAVTGGGLTGIETATELAEAYPHLRVSLVTDGIPGKGLSSKGRAYIAQTFEKMGVQVHNHVRITRVEAGILHPESGESIPFEIGVWCGSFEAALLAREAGFAVNKKGQMLVDPYMRSISHPEVYAAGDAAAFMVDPGAPMRMACATAVPMGAHVADNVLALVQGHAQQPFNFHYGGQCISLGRNRALVQFVRSDDSPKEQVLRGGRAAVVKELICRIAFWSLPLERRFPGAFMWQGKGKKPAGYAEWRQQQFGQPVRHH